MRRSAGILAALLVVVVLAGCGRPIRGKVERGIADAMPKTIGPAKSYRVSVSGSTLGMIRGNLDTMQIIGEDVQLPNGITLANLTVNSRDIAFDRSKHTLSRVASTDFSATLAECELNRYLVKMYPDAPALGVELASGKLHIRACPMVAGLMATIKADAKLKIKQEHLLILDLLKVTAVGIPTPGFAREYLESKVNPIFDSSDLGYNARLSSVSIKPGSVTLSGSLDLTAPR